MRDNLEEINEKEKQRKRLKEKGKECKKEGKNINDTKGERKKEEKNGILQGGIEKGQGRRERNDKEEGRGGK